MSAEAELPFGAEDVPLVRWPDGSVRVRGGRSPYYLFVETFDRGATPEQLAERFDSLTLADVYVLIGHRLRHHAAVTAYLAEVERQAADIRAKFELLNGPQPTRAELLARLAARKAAVG